MKTPKTLRRWNSFPLLITLCFVLFSVLTSAQAPQTIFVRLVFQKVAPGQEQEYEKIMKENIKPMHQMRKQNGRIIGWRLFKVHFTGANDEYNYVGVSYYDSWAKTEPNENFPEMIKAANPKADAAAIIAKFRSLRTITHEALYSREEYVTSKTPAPLKYIIIDYMKVRDGMANEYVKVETEDWKPFHQLLVNENKMASWGLWGQVFTSGGKTAHDYVTSNAYSSYDQIGNINYAETFKRANPTKDVQASFERADKSRDRVRSELWEMIDFIP